MGCSRPPLMLYLPRYKGGDPLGELQILTDILYAAVSVFGDPGAADGWVEARTRRMTEQLE